MSSYDNDERVTPFGDTGGYNVARDDGTTVQVLETGAFGWTVCAGPNLDFVPTTDGGFAIGYPNADVAIGDALAASQAVDEA